MSRALPRHDPYAALRCSCGHLCSWHVGATGRCFAGDHSRRCDCQAYRHQDDEQGGAT